jgi:hypothetical protein
MLLHTSYVLLVAAAYVTIWILAAAAATVYPTMIATAELDIGSVELSWKQSCCTAAVTPLSIQRGNSMRSWPDTTVTLLICMLDQPVCTT